MVKARRPRDSTNQVGKVSSVLLDSTSFRALYYWGKIMGVNPLSLSVENNQLKFSYVALFYGCFLGSVYCYLASRAATERIKLSLPSETPISFIVDFMRIVCQCLNGSSTWFVFAIYQNRVKLIVKSLAKAERTSRILGIPEDYVKRLREFASRAAVWNILSLATLVFADVMWTRRNYDRFTLRIFNLTTISSFNMFLLFVSSLVLVREKLDRLNEKVRHVNLEFRQTDQGTSRGLTILKSRCCPKFQLDTINMVLQLHHELRITIDRIEKHFALVILFCIANNFTYITLMTYRMYRHVREQRPLGGIAYDYVGVLVCSVLYYVAMLIAISNVCASTVDKANNTGNMLHTMINNHRDIGSTHQTTGKPDLFFLDLLKNQVSMSVFGLFKLNNFLLCSIVSSVINYLTIMLQLQD